MRRLWLLFAQTATVGLAIWFIVATLKPDWLGGTINGTYRTNNASSTTALIEAPYNVAPAQGSYRDAAKRAMPSVVNIFTTKEAKQSKNPLMDDPFFRRFFGEQEEKQFSLGSGVIVSPQGYILTN